MSLIVQKFGGTSVGDLERIAKAAERVAHAVRGGNSVAVVVSAMAGETDKLVGYVRGVADDLDQREYDAVVASGEQVTAGLMALTLQKMGIPSRSWSGWQVPVITDSSHSRARVLEVKPAQLQACLDEGMVPVVTGFQGISQEGRITTLGRGGSDLSAVVLAAALGAERCDIYTDVEGVFTCDPRIVAKARKLDKITYEEMLEMASQGAKVLHTRSVATAMNHRVRLQVLSTFTGAPGTLVVDEDEIVEQQVVSGIAYSRDDAKITMIGLPDRPGIAASLFGPLADAEINVDMIVQNISPDGESTDLTFTVAEGDLGRALAVLEANNNELQARRVVPDTRVVKVSVIGVGMRSHAGVAGKMFQALAEKGINIQLISTSEIKISVLIAEEYLELALRALHSAYDLDAAE
jgi:aspartate kinase